MMTHSSKMWRRRSWPQKNSWKIECGCGWTGRADTEKHSSHVVREHWKTQCPTDPDQPQKLYSAIVAAIISLIATTTAAIWTLMTENPLAAIGYLTGAIWSGFTLARELIE